MEYNNNEGGAKFINKLYDNLTYFDQYSNSVMLFIIITILIISFHLYFFIMAKKEEIKDDWINQKCNPFVIPFAGFINKPYNKSISEFTKENYTYCMQDTLKNITGNAIQPLSFITNVFKLFYLQCTQNINDMRSVFNDIRTGIGSVSEDVMNRLLNVVVPLQQVGIGFKDSMAKTQGIFTAGLFTSLGTYMTVKSVLGAIAQLIINILYGMIATIIALWLLPFTWGAAASLTAIFVSASIPLSIMVIFLSKVMKVEVSAVPKLPPIKKGGANVLKAVSDFGNRASKAFVGVGKDVGKEIAGIGKQLGKEIVNVGKEATKEIVNIGEDAGKEIVNIGEDAGKEIVNIGQDAGREISNIGKSAGKAIKKVGNLFRCFDKNTKIKLFDGKYKNISEINLLEELHDGSFITAKMTIDSTDMDMYILDDVIVSGSHVVKYHGKWIFVRNHPRVTKIGFYNEPYLYCINTSNKKIVINNTTFTDWDEIYDDSLVRVRDNINIFTNDYSKVYGTENIHKYLDGGFKYDTLIHLKNGEYKKISDIKVNDVLENGEIVYGTVIIDGTLLNEQYEIDLGKNKSFIGGPNLNIKSKKIDETRTMYLVSPVKKLVDIKETKLYHLLTDMKKFKVGKLKFHDYNSCIDLF